MNGVGRVDPDLLERRLRACSNKGLAEWSPPAGPDSGWEAAAVLAGTSSATPVTPAAVLVGLLELGGETQVILTRRTPQLSDHPGEVSLPGGRLEPEDAGPEAAALREAHEEVGLPPDQVRVLGCLPTYRTVTDYFVHPVVGWVEPPVSLRPDPKEVAEVFLVPLGFLLDPANYGLGSVVRNGVRRTYYELVYEGRRIWGATAGILASLAQLLAQDG